MDQATLPPEPRSLPHDGSSNGSVTGAPVVAWAVEFDFAAKRERQIAPADAKPSTESGKFVWIDLDAVADADLAEATLTEMGVNTHAVREAVGPDVDGRHDVYDDCLHIAVTAGVYTPRAKGAASTGESRLRCPHVDIVIGERFLITLRRGPVEFIEQVRRHYRQDFYKFAQTPSFLLYEYWDALIHSYRKTLRAMALEVERVQDEIFAADASDAIFNEVSAVTRDLLSFRKIMLAAREVLHELSSRRSPFVSENTQPFLEKMVDTLERLSSDLAVEREILSETLNLYMGIVSHRTNKVVSRLTVVSMVFLPLTFIVGVYGQNFENMPELGWRYGYFGVWALLIVIAVGLLVFMKRREWW